MINYETGDVSAPLTYEQCRILVAKAGNKERLLIALALGSGMPINEVEQLKAGQLGYPLIVGSRALIAPAWAIATHAKWYQVGSDKRVFSSSAKYMKEAIQRYTGQLLGVPKSYQALRRTFVTRCAQGGIPMEVVVQNTGERPDIIMGYYKNAPKKLELDIEGVLGFK
jgi:hypothetical protein